jgi:thiamine-phosphate pyrophosphorylase
VGVLDDARLYFVVEASASDHLLDSALAGGCDLLQLRDHDASEDELLAAAERFRDACDAHGALFVVNDRPEIALQAGADGVHVGQDDLPVDAVRRLVGPDVFIGLSTHAPEQFDAALASDADYLSVGPVWETPTKAGRPAVGLELVRYAAEHARVPFFAIGGIDEGNVAAVAEAGAPRVVVVRAIANASDPAAAARALLAGVGERSRVGAA